MFESLQDMLTLSDPGRDPKLTLAYGTLLTMILRAETTRRAAACTTSMAADEYFARTMRESCNFYELMRGQLFRKCPILLVSPSLTRRHTRTRSQGQTCQ